MIELRKSMKRGDDVENEIKMFIKGKLNKTYLHQKVTVFSDADIEIMEGEIYHVTSASKKGKSSLLRILANVEYNDVYTLGFFVKSEDISYMPPQLHHYTYMTVNDYIQFHAEINVKFLTKDALDCLSLFRINLDEKIKDLTEREKMIINLIVCLSQEKKLYVIDEPFLHTISDDIPLWINLIKKRYDEHKTFIIATQHETIMSFLSTVLITIEDPSHIVMKRRGDHHA
jgi:ABC-2 type transport system ATP-binding protein